MQRWQHQWEMENKGRHMYSIQTQVSRLRIGHTGLNKSRRSCLSIQQVSVIGVEEVKRLNMSSCIVEDREQLLEEFRNKEIMILLL